MALPSRFTGTVNSRSRGVIDAIEKQLKYLNLKPAKKLTFSYNPFYEKVSSIRNTSHYLFRNSVRETNRKCIYKTTVHNSVDEPLLEVELGSGFWRFGTSEVIVRHFGMSGAGLLYFGMSRFGESGHQILFKTANLTPLEILQKFNELISSKHKENK